MNSISKITFAAIIALGAACAIAAGSSKTTRRKLSPEDLIPSYHVGGRLEVKGSLKGRIVLDNQTTRMSSADLELVRAYLAKNTQCKVEIGKPDGAEVVVTIVDNKDAPTMTALPEDYRATVNIGKLDKNLKNELALKKFFPTRCRKEVLRAFAFACGVGGSQYPDNIMDLKDITDLDLREEFIPADTVDQCIKRLAAAGVTPARTVTYKKACREGWAPAPTNDIQKAIWDEVHDLPTKPIVIGPEKKQ